MSSEHNKCFEYCAIIIHYPSKRTVDGTRILNNGFLHSLTVQRKNNCIEPFAEIDASQLRMVSEIGKMTFI